MQEDIKNHAYRNYLEFKEIIKLLTDHDLSISDIQKKTQIPTSTAYKKMKVLQNLGVIQVKKYRLVNGRNKVSLFSVVET